FQRAFRQLRGVPGQWRRQRLRQEMIGQSREIPPVRVAGEELDHARHEEESKQQPAEKPDPGKRGDTEDQREKSSLQQEGIPLVSHERLAAIEKRKVQNMNEDKAQAWQEIEGERQRGGCAGPADGRYREIAGIEPEDHRGDEEA